MKVKLIALTGVESLSLWAADITTAEGLVAYCARVSNPSNQFNPDNERLMRYLQEHKHWSPFEMAHAVLEIQTTRDIARQILRHRTFSFQEWSQRYQDPTCLQFKLRECRLQDTKNRQNSLAVSDRWLQWQWRVAQKAVIWLSRWVYQAALRRGVAKEVARAVLPEGLTPSRLYMSGSLRSWLHYLEVRLGPETQKEHREVAQACAAALAAHVPSLFSRFLALQPPSAGGS
jgi:thymidylate synthase (FAD)